MWWLIPVGTFALGILVGVWVIPPDRTARKPRFDSPYARIVRD